LRGIARRAAVVNGVPWQTFFTALGEFSGTLADPVVIRGFTARRTPHASATSDATAAHCHPDAELVEAAAGAQSKGEGAPEPTAGFEAALEPVARRMERVKLPPAFLREALSPGATLELRSLAMQWAGMPNKNERAALREALDALTANGYLEQTGEETWSVLHAAD